MVCDCWSDGLSVIEPMVGLLSLLFKSSTATATSRQKYLTKSSGATATSMALPYYHSIHDAVFQYVKKVGDQQAGLLIKPCEFINSLLKLYTLIEEPY